VKISKRILNGKDRLMQTDVKPFLKWAGGKAQLLPQINKVFPSQLEQFDTFAEPFVGGGAVVFYILENYPRIKNIIINDINSRLIKTYIAIKESPRELVAFLEEFQYKYWELDHKSQRLLYLAKRERFNTGKLSTVELASLFIFLNKTCFNGLYRVNKKNEFNVPFGEYRKPLICNRKLIAWLSELLQKVTILEGDYTCTLDFLHGRSFVYFDPPYKPVSNTSNFTSYSAAGFDDTQQTRLASFCKTLDVGNKWMLSNSCNGDDNFFRKHYRNYTIRQITARRSIGAKAGSRRNIRELLITNY
jgi:DNA adenine methylase